MSNRAPSGIAIRALVVMSPSGPPPFCSEPGFVNPDGPQVQAHGPAGLRPARIDTHDPARKARLPQTGVTPSDRTSGRASPRIMTSHEVHSESPLHTRAWDLISEPTFDRSCSCFFGGETACIIATSAPIISRKGNIVMKPPVQLGVRHRRVRRGFVIVWGSRGVVLAYEPEPPLQAACPASGRWRPSRHQCFSGTSRSFSSPSARIAQKVRFTECSVCRNQFRMPLEAMRARLGRATAVEHVPRRHRGTAGTARQRRRGGTHRLGMGNDRRRRIVHGDGCLCRRCEHDSGIRPAFAATGSLLQPQQQTGGEEVMAVPPPRPPQPVEAQRRPIRKRLPGTSHHLICRAVIQRFRQIGPATLPTSNSNMRISKGCGSGSKMGQEIASAGKPTPPPRC